MSGFDKFTKNQIMTPEEVARYLRKSQSWVYKNWRVLGGVKLGGSILFPSKETIHERLFSQGQGVEVRLHPKGDQAHERLVHDQKSGKGGRGKKKARAEEPAASGGGDDPNRHGILGPGQ
jgi:hypothetical protein